MRCLTLDEKISLKGVFAFKRLSLPKLYMEQAVSLWYSCCGYRITKWHLYRGAH
jgi:hypothetical protein